MMSDSETELLLTRVLPTLEYLTYETWGFGESVSFEALLRATELTGDERWASFARGWGRGWARRRLPWRRLDCTVPGLALVEIATRYGDEELMSALTELGDYLMTRPECEGVYETWEHSPLRLPYGPGDLDEVGRHLLTNPPPGVFLDCLHFDPPFLLALSLHGGHQKYATAGLRQALGYIRLLQRESGTFDHFVLRGVPGTFGPGWGRGQGWALLGLLDTIELCRRLCGNPNDAEYARPLALMEGSARRLIRAMVALQRPDGHWHAVVTDRASGDEYSTTAFMAAGLYRALSLQLVAGNAMQAAADAAWSALVASVDENGRLREVSAAVMACTERTHYSHVPRGYLVPWGQGPVVVAAAARHKWRAAR